MAYTPVIMVLILHVIGKKLKKVFYCRNLIVCIACMGWYMIDRVEEKKKFTVLKKKKKELCVLEKQWSTMLTKQKQWL